MPVVMMSEILQLTNHLHRVPRNQLTASNTTEDEEFFCKWILFADIKQSRVRVWDVAILVSNALFLLYLIARANRARLKLRATSSPIFLTFYALVILNVLVGVLRCIVSMTVNAAMEAGEVVDKVLWVTVRFFLLATEMSVVIFGLAFGHLDSKTSIRRVLLATSAVSLAFSICQGTLEIVSPEESSYIPSKEFHVFTHGGAVFWCSTSLLFTFVYFTVYILPWTRLRERLALPTRRSFYRYVLFLCILNGFQCVGSGLLLAQRKEGLCMVDVTSYLYFAMLTPLVYYTFLQHFFGVSQPHVMFSYKAQVDDTMEDDNVSLPHQQSFSSLKTDSDFIYQSSGVYDNTTIDSAGAPAPHPLYAASLQSPDSITGYSISSQNVGDMQ